MVRRKQEQEGGSGRRGKDRDVGWVQMDPDLKVEVR